jgi:hypothetical protein
MRRLKKKAYYRRVKEKIQPNEDGLRWKKGQ